MTACCIALAAAAIVAGTAGQAHAASPGHMYVTANRSAVQLRMLTGERLTTGSITFGAKCSSGDVIVKIRRGRVNHRDSRGGYGIRIIGRATTRAFTGTLTSWGPDCSLSRRFAARRHY